MCAKWKINDFYSTLEIDIDALKDKTQRSNLILMRKSIAKIGTCIESESEIDSFVWFDFVVYLAHVLDLQVAVKRQQAVEDAIAMRLMSNETGKTIDTLPPGKIFGMSITEPCTIPSNANATENRTLVQKAKSRKYFYFRDTWWACKRGHIMRSMQGTNAINLIATVELFIYSVN